MLDLEFLQKMLIIAIALSTITCAFIQKTKIFFKSSKFISLYSFIVNVSIGVIFCMTFTDLHFPKSLWVGLFSFLGADTIYKSLEGKITPHRELVTRKRISIPTENIINKEEK
ncbi:MAG: hypothetical protein HFE81_04745 [Bacilli bacterium]|nr:hypothetical protein [Bacilli bacterium]